MEVFTLHMQARIAGLCADKVSNLKFLISTLDMRVLIYLY